MEILNITNCSVADVVSLTEKTSDDKQVVIFTSKHDMQETRQIVSLKKHVCFSAVHEQYLTYCDIEFNSVIKHVVNEFKQQPSKQIFLLQAENKMVYLKLLSYFKSPVYH